ncbi:MAG: elongation factor P-like protein YeiP [Gammaproteobacteria bacterium]|nr:elongation factor P-like protein YeiP [Gammaproteobacteria bacterium]
MKANELKRGVVFLHDGQNIAIKQLHVQTACSRSGNTLYKIKGYNVVSGQKFECSFKGDDVITPVDISRREVQLLFRDADGCTFMDKESYEQHTLADELVSDELLFMTEDLEGINALIIDEAIVGIELPASVSLEIVDCAPAMKAASSSARTKPATLSTGLIVQVPEYLKSGDIIKVNTETQEFVSRA